MVTKITISIEVDGSLTEYTVKTKAEALALIERCYTVVAPKEGVNHD
jgi:hypothetical protein